MSGYQGAREASDAGTEQQAGKSDVEPLDPAVLAQDKIDTGKNLVSRRHGLDYRLANAN
jgi:hypothetical protein